MSNKDLQFLPHGLTWENCLYDPQLHGVYNCIVVDNGSKQANDPSSDASNLERFSSCRYQDMIKVKDQLTARISSLKIIPVVGMGGIGKTTLAQSLYKDSEISYQFHVRSWVTISQEYELKNVLLHLLRSMGSFPSELPEMGDEYFLAERLYRCLKGRRYLIVLDDVWSQKTWNELKDIFPNDNNGSRIILTTRDAEVATCDKLCSPPYSLECLNIDESWRLLCHKLFVGKSCPPDLVEIGKEIAKGCQGLPLAIVVVAGHLSKIDMNRDCWADVGKGLASLLRRNEEQLLDILCLSFNHLPQHLKACFLYMGVFPRNSEILIRKVIRLWCAAGFLKAESPESMEGNAEKCMKELISRNLLTVKKKKYDNSAKKCGIHDLLWDLILRETQREGHRIFGSSGSSRQPHYSFPKYLMIHLTSSYLHLGTSSYKWDAFLNSECFSLLKVLDIHSVCFPHFPDELIEIVSLRYLELATCANIPASISKLRNLESLVNKHKWAGPILPKEIWLLKRLRHLHVGTCTFLPKTLVSRVDGSSVSILPHLLTLSTISFASCTEQVFSSIPNLKQLKIHEIGDEDEHLFDCLSNLSCLGQLEELNIKFCPEMRRQAQSLSRDTFPQGIKRLTLIGSHLPWEDMDTIAMLPNLQVLKLKKNAFKGPLYEPTREFSGLKLLLFEDLDLELWIADTINFPVLQHLVVKFCRSLKEIPSCIGDIPTLESIWLLGCSDSANESARTIRQEQWEDGNDDLRVHIQQRAMLLDWSFFGGKITEKTIQLVRSLPEVSSVAVVMEKKAILLTAKDPVQTVRRLTELCHTEIASVRPSKEPDEEEAGTLQLYKFLRIESN